MGFGVTCAPASLVVQGLKEQNDEIFSFLSAIINFHIIEYAVHFLNALQI